MARLLRIAALQSLTQASLSMGERPRAAPPAPSSLRRCFAERDARTLGNCGALGADHSPGPASTSGAGNRAEDAIPNPDFASDGLLERVCDRLKGDIGRDPLCGDDLARDLEALHPRYLLRSAVRRHKAKGDFFFKQRRQAINPGADTHRLASVLRGLHDL
ncbi:hypothetical protein B0H14DRAFT_3440023 [Mycena olivaceomarginata]|nr:hypothetical protein B0H14DRAFT_3440023 [Mycena olivaceomarginata]